MKKNAAFSLVEILIVTAVIIMLAVLVLPALKHAQKQQRTAYYQQTLNNYAGYPASAAQLQNSEVYEVTAVWQDQTHPTNFSP